MKKLTVQRQLVISSILFILPAFLVLGIFRFLPVLMSARISLFNSNLLQEAELFIGLDNYVRALNDVPLRNALSKTLIFVSMKVPLEIVVSLGLAILVNRRWFGIGVVRSAPLMAFVIPMSIAAVIWRMMYHPSNGIINSILLSLGFSSQGFLVDRAQAMPALVAMTIWKDAGFYMIIYLAGLQGISEDYYEAARVDGATSLQEFWHITLPLLRGTTMLVLILSTVFSFNIFVPAYVMTGGGPAGATEVIVYYMYKVGFRFYQMGYANTIAIITLVIVLAIAALQLRLTPSDES